MLKNRVYFIMNEGGYNGTETISFLLRHKRKEYNKHWIYSMYFDFRGYFFIFYGKSLLCTFSYVYRSHSNAICPWGGTLIFYKRIDNEKFSDNLFKAFIPTILIIAFYTYMFLNIEYPNYEYLELLKRYIRYCRFAILLGFFILASRYLLSSTKTYKLVKTLIKYVNASVILTMLFFTCTYLVYYIKYKTLFSDVAFMSILMTTYNEAIEYILVIIETPLIMFAIIGVLILIPLLTAYTLHNIKMISYSYRQHYLFFVFFVIFAIGLSLSVTKVFPFDQYLFISREAGVLKGFDDLSRNIDKNDSSMQLVTPISLKKGTTFFVIGESANRDYMSVYNNIDPNTTPWELNQKNNNNFIFFDFAYANYPGTAMALSRTLTQVNQYNGKELAQAKSLIGLAEKAGYKTYWFSTQGKNGMYDSIIATIAEKSKKRFWLNGYDNEILNKLNEIDETENNFVVIHILGSHARYTDRVPADFQPDKYPHTKDGEYMRTLEYTDKLLENIYNYGKEHLNLNAMVYMSDHGENLEYGHTDNPFYYEMVHIPTWVYLSDSFKASSPEVYQNLKNNKNKVFTNDLMFELISSLLGAHLSDYNPEFDISSDKYKINLDNAMTVHNKYRIKDDPVFKK